MIDPEQINAWREDLKEGTEQPAYGMAEYYRRNYCAHVYFDGASAFKVRQGVKGFWRQCQLCGEIEEQ